ncbi:MAG: hypothetical protein AAGG44_20510, partial [Planctomycetota bacterium]
MNNRKQEKTSPILMLAPVALALLGYHYMFHSKLNSDLASRRKVEIQTEERTHDIQHEQLAVLGKIASEKRELEKAKNEIQLAREEESEVEAKKSELTDFVRGRGLTLSGDAAANNSAQELGAAGTSAFGQFTSLIASASGLADSVSGSRGLDAGGQCSQMSSLCSILEEHSLIRLGNSFPPSNAAGGLVAAERKQLG